MRTTPHRQLAPVRWLVCLFVGLFLVAPTWPGTTPASEAAPRNAWRSPVAQERPNIVLITTDDQATSDLSMMRHVQERLVGRGAVFTNSIAPAPLCCPARASMLTGQYAHNHGVLGNVPPWGGFQLFDDSSTVATWLQDSGYATGFVGKYLNEYGEDAPQYIPPGWTEWRATLPEASRYVDFRLNVGGVVQHFPTIYKTDLFNRMAVDFVDRRAASDSPFFLWLSHGAPHAGGPVEPDDPSSLGLAGHNPTPAVPARYRDAFNHQRLSKPPGFDEARVGDKPRYVRDTNRLRDNTIAAIEEMVQQRRESLLAVDDGVDAVLDALQRSGELDRTLVILTSDNGMMYGHHRLWNKFYPYTPSIRVPLVMRGPGVPTDVQRSQPVGTIDLAPTIVDAADVAPGVDVDGRSLLPLAADAAFGARRTMLLELGGAPGGLNAWPTMFYTGVRTQNWIYVEYGTGERELYDRVKDPFQLRSRHADPAYRDVRIRLADVLDRLRDCAGPTCR